MYVFALDIGYSNLKIAFGTPGAMQTLTRPATAGPTDRMPYSGESRIGRIDPVFVDLDGKAWVACVEPGRLQGVDREIHADYTKSDSYRALFLAALSFAEHDRIDVLVTGLPVHQAKDPVVVDRVGKAFVGKHKISAKRTVDVRHVKVVAQPTGAFNDLVCTIDPSQLDLISEGRVVVVDPGFFSVDYIVVDRGELRQQVSGTSLKAMLMLLDTANDAIKRDFGTGPGAERLEYAMQNERPTVRVAGRQVEIAPYLAHAESAIAREALVQMRKDMRTEGENVDMLLLAGGGARHYLAAARDVYPHCTDVRVADKPHLANVRGYFAIGELHAAG